MERPKSHDRRDAIIIGAGHNGLTAAAYLARAGLRVLVLERGETLGGAAVSESPWPGWTVSAASYVCSLLLPEIIETLELRKHGYAAYRKDPFSFTAAPDGSSLLLGTDPALVEREVGKFSKRDVAGLRAYDAEVARLGSALFEQLAVDEPSFDTFSERDRATLLGSAAELAERYVETPILAAALANEGVIGTFAGPRDPGTGYVLVHHAAGRALGVQGAWGYVRGGMGSISRAIAAAATAAGAELRTSAPVEQILTSGGQASGVVLRDGSEHRAPFVLSNAHPAITFGRLVPKGCLPEELLAKLRAWRSIGVSFKLNLALGELPNFSARPSREPADHHRASIHVAPNIEYLDKAADQAKAGGVSSRPMLECFLQTPTDPALAPPGKHLLSVFAQYFPYDRADGPWTRAQTEAAADSIVALLGEVAPNLPGSVEARQALSPADLEQRFGLVGGHIFHGELLPGQIFEERFAVRTPLPGLYLCGSGTHPGGCVSGAPGLRAARAVLADLSRAGIETKRPASAV